MAEIAKELDISLSSAHRRTTCYGEGPRLLEGRYRRQSRFAYEVGDGRVLTMQEIAAEAGCSVGHVSRQISYGVEGPALLQLGQPRDLAKRVAARAHSVRKAPKP